MSAAPLMVRTEAEDALLAAFEAAGKNLPGDKWIARLRAAAIDRFRHTGLPTRRVEEWKYTDLRALMRTAAPLSSQTKTAATAAPGDDPLSGLDRAVLVIINGAYDKTLSDLEGLKGVKVTSIADALAKGDRRIGALIEDNPDTALALNTAFMAGGVLIEVADGAQPARPLEIMHIVTDTRATGIYVRNVVSVGKGASVRIVESYRGPAGVAYQANAASELTLSDGARAIWAKLQLDGDAALHLGTLAAQVGSNVEFDHLTVTAGSAATRSQIYMAIAGEGSRTSLNGTNLLGGMQHVDLMLSIDHLAPDDKTRVLYKNIARGKATGAFQGKIHVHQRAQKTDAKMMNRTLLLSDEASFAAKPELEIWADDVTCGHGSTSGRIDDDMLFYFLSRGIPRAEAERLLIIAFLSEAIEAIGDPALIGALEPLVEERLAAVPASELNARLA